MKEFLEYAKSKGVETIDVDLLCLISDFLEKKESKQFSLQVVSDRRELLKKWWKYFDEESVAVNCNEQEREEVINNFFNCG